MIAVEPFSARIQKRYQVWWGPVPNGFRGWTERLHRHKEHFTYRTKDASESSWHCCQNWQRTLANKWNARQFVQMLGCGVSELYWSGRWIDALPLDTLPDHFVIRPNYGHSRKNVLAMASGVNLLKGQPYSKEALRRHLKDTHGRFSKIPLLVQEFVKQENGDYTVPIEYQCYVFRDVVSAVQRIERGPNFNKSLFYTPAWEPFTDRMRATVPPDEYRDPPKCLDQILKTAATLGKAYGTFVRIDLFASDRGCVFNEFTGTPARGTNFTPYAEEFLGALWKEHLGDSV